MAESGPGVIEGVVGGKSRFDDIYDRPDPALTSGGWPRSNTRSRIMPSRSSGR
ncbi:hypothetical protein ACFQ0G_02340 [Streptomyces chiangmaiensis]